MIGVLQAIVHKLCREFGEDVPIYVDKQEQGVTLPCFFVRVSQSELIPQFGRYYFLDHLATIVYMGTEDHFALEEMRFRLLTCLEDIPTTKGCHGTDLRAEIRDADVVFTGSYRLWIEKEKIPEPNMLTLDQTHHVKGDRDGNEKI